MDRKNLLSSFPKKSGALLAGLVGVVLVGIIDGMAGVGISFSILYSFPIFIATWFGGRTAGIVVASFAAIIWLGSDLMEGPVYSDRLIPFWNFLVRLGFFLAIAILLDKLRLVTSNLDTIVRKRTTALESEMARRKVLEHEVTAISRKEQVRIARELHDQVGGNLAGIAFRAKALAENLERDAAVEASSARHIVQALNTTMEQVRSFARLLTPPELEQASLRAGLSQLSAEIETTYGVVCAIEAAEVLPSLAYEQVQHLYRIAQEAIRNAIRHGEAKRIEVRVTQKDDALLLQISNDGKPWTPPDPNTVGLGLRIIQDRTRFLGGVYSIQSDRRGETCLSCQIPMTPDRGGRLQPQSLRYESRQ